MTESANAQSPMIWLVRKWGMEIYKDGKLVGTVPTKNFPLLISDLANALWSVQAEGHEGSHAAAAHPDAG